MVRISALFLALLGFAGSSTTNKREQESEARDRAGNVSLRYETSRIYDESGNALVHRYCNETASAKKSYLIVSGLSRECAWTVLKVIDLQPDCFKENPIGVLFFYHLGRSSSDPERDGRLSLILDPTKSRKSDDSLQAYLDRQLEVYGNAAVFFCRGRSELRIYDRSIETKDSIKKSAERMTETERAISVRQPLPEATTEKGGWRLFRLKLSRTVRDKDLLAQTEPFLDTFFERRNIRRLRPGGNDENRTMVDLADLSNEIIVDLPYARSDNFVGSVLYDDNRCFLQLEVALLLVDVQKDLRKSGYGLKMLDCYRPLPVQWKLWEKMPRPGLVADPRTGSNHNRGIAVDCTLVDRKGNEVAMPSEYDSFGTNARSDYKGGSAEARRNRDRLIEAMRKYGFRGIVSEWWHFEAEKRTRYPDLISVDFKSLAR